MFFALKGDTSKSSSLQGDSGAAPAPLVPGFAWRLMLPVFTIVCLDTASSGAVLPVLPFYLKHLGGGPLLLGAVLGAEALCQLVAAPWLGQLSDRYGRKRVLLASQVGALFSLALLATANSVVFVLLARVLLGLTAANFATAAAYAADNSSPANRRQAIGVLSAGMGLGGMAGPALSSRLADISLTAPIWIAMMISATSIVVTLMAVKAGNPPDQRSRNLVISAPLHEPRSFRALVSAPVIRILVLVLLCHYFSYGMFSSQLPLFLSDTFVWNDHAFGPRELGYILTADGAINIIVQLLLLRWLGRHFTERNLIVLILAGLAIGYVIAGMATGIAMLALAVLCISTGVALARPTFMAALSIHVSNDRQGVVFGTMQSLVAITDVVSPVLAGLMIANGLYWPWIGVVVATALAGAVIARGFLPPVDPKTTCSGDDRVQILTRKHKASKSG